MQSNPSLCLDAGNDPANGSGLKLWSCGDGWLQQSWTHEGINLLSLDNSQYRPPLCSGPLLTKAQISVSTSGRSRARAPRSLTIRSRTSRPGSAIEMEIATHIRSSLRTLFQTTEVGSRFGCQTLLRITVSETTAHYLRYCTPGRSTMYDCMRKMYTPSPMSNREVTDHATAESRQDTAFVNCLDKDLTSGSARCHLYTTAGTLISCPPHTLQKAQNHSLIGLKEWPQAKRTHKYTHREPSPCPETADRSMTILSLHSSLRTFPPSAPFFTTCTIQESATPSSKSRDFHCSVRECRPHRCPRLPRLSASGRHQAFDRQSSTTCTGKMLSLS